MGKVGSRGRAGRWVGKELGKGGQGRGGSGKGGKGVGKVGKG